MSKQAESKAVEYSGRVYRWLLAAYPKSHRQEYGAAMLQLFRDQCRDAWGARRIRGLIGFWLRALADLLKTSVLEHLSNFKWSRIMSISFRPTIKPLPAFFGICALIFFPIFLASVAITWLLPEAYAGQTAILINSPSAGAASASDPDWVHTEIKILFSHDVLESVSKKLDLKDVWGKKYNNSTPMSDADVLGMLNARLEVFVPNLPGKLVHTAPLVQVRAYSDNPEEAALLANGVVESYRDLRAAESQPAAAPIERRVTIMSAAVPNNRPVRPNKQLNCVIGALAGILVGVIIAPLILGVVASIRKNRSAPPPVPQRA